MLNRQYMIFTMVLSVGMMAAAQGPTTLKDAYHGAFYIGAAIELVKKLQAAGIKISVVGVQGHDSLDWPTLKDEEATINELAALGVKVAITELDIDVLPKAADNTADISLNVHADPKLNPYVTGLPDAQKKELAQRYADLFRICWMHRDQISRVTLWGVTDGDSWKNNWPVMGRTNYPLLWDRSGKPKLAQNAVLQVPKGL
jgi:endo-1,4-beta-xylanase